MTMRNADRIFVAGHRGLVGSALTRGLRERGYGNLLLRSHVELDLGNQSAVAEFFRTERPEHVFLAAARVGGILANDTYPAEFIHQNLAIQTNVIHEAWRNGVKRLLFLGSSCIYPRDCNQPIREDYLLTGPLEATNRAYAIAKIAGIEMCWSYNRQYGTRYLCAMPTNLYGPGDNYDPLNSHVIPALLRKFHEARISAVPTVAVWGSGTPRREFLYSDDMADACIFLMSLTDSEFDAALRTGGTNAPLINVGTGEDLSIGELAELVRDVTGYQGNIVYDRAMPDGTPRKLLDVSRLRDIGWCAATDLRSGLARAYADYCRYLGG
jgi:GDP-L-fucose synthase